MFSLVPVLAEVSDKVTRLPVLFLWSAALVLLAWALIRKKKWLAILPAGFGALFAVAATAEVRDPFVGPAIITELGHSYVAFAYLSAALPFIAILTFAVRKNEKA
jgi:hypothetical protein